MLNKKNLFFFLFYSIIVFVVFGTVLTLCRVDMYTLLNAFSIFNISQLLTYTQKLLFMVIFASVLIVLIIAVCRVRPEISVKKHTPFLIAGAVFYFLAIELLGLALWSLTRFPMNQPEIVFFGLININGPVDEAVYPEAFFVSVLCLLLTIGVVLAMFFYQKKTRFAHFSLSFGEKVSKPISINMLFFFAGIFLFVLGFIDQWGDLEVSEYAKVIKKYSLPATDSQFYSEEYITPEYSKIKFPDEKKNLIIIFIESMESSFADKASGGVLQTNIIPNLTKYAKENINFSNTELLGGGFDASGTSWTVAALCSKLAGLPFNLKGRGNSSSRSQFLPGAIALTDILAYNGYKQRFLMGSDKTFGSRDIFLETHGGVEVHDLVYHWNTGKLPRSYHVFWGFEDQKLYAYAKEELQDMASQEEPFMFAFLTVDTHMPNGYECELCEHTEEKEILNAVKCADKQVGEFLDWCKEQPWYDDTVIVIMGDHLFMSSYENNPFDNTAILNTSGVQSPRRWIDIFINAQISDKTFDHTRTQNRTFSSFDMFPTILASLGCEIQGNRLGFGANLFSQEPTLFERLDEDYVNDELMRRTLQYEKLEYPQFFSE